MFGIDDLAIAGIGAGAGILSGLFGAAGSREAAEAQRRSVNQALAFQREMARQGQANYQQQRSDQAPWLQAGTSSLAELLRQMQGGAFDSKHTNFDPSQIANDPGYQFRMAEGQKALERSAAARGGLMSGGFTKALTRYGQGVASEEFGNAYNRHENAWARDQSEKTGQYNRLASLAGIGQQAAQNLGNFGAQQNANLGNYGNTMASLMGQMGNANSAGIMGQANAYSGMAGTLGNLANQYGMMNYQSNQQADLLRQLQAMRVPGQGGR